MARTSRNGAPSANVQALDNLDLDDMFADGGDDLFDGLDIDLGGMDDIASGENADSPAQGNRRSAAAAPEPAAAAAPEPAAPEEDVEEAHPKRRKTKRKTTAPAFFDDDDDYVEEPKKKRRSTKPPATKKRVTKKAAAAAASEKEDSKPTAAPLSSRKSKAKSTSMPPPPLAKVSAGGTATASTGRQKKSGPGTRNSAKASSEESAAAETAPVSNTPAESAATTSKTAKSQASQQTPPHPGLTQSTFCGLLPSKTLFYPFLPALPPEVALKNRRIYALLERMHTSFVGQMASSTTTKIPNGIQPAKETEPIFQLMQEAFKDEKPSTGTTAGGSAPATQANKSEIIGNALGSIRRTIEFFDKTKLSQDLLAVCALLKRQHDFLKQNSANMQQWCRDNFTDEDYAEVYLPPDARRKSGLLTGEVDRRIADLASLFGKTVRVKLICAGFKEPKAGLQALIPGKGMGVSVTGQKTSPNKLSKKRKAPPDETKHPTAAPAIHALVLPPSYAQLRPAKRRKAVADLIARTAYALDSEYFKRIEERRQAFVTREKRAKEAAEDKIYQVTHTAGMWKWLEEMGYCEDQIDNTALRERLEVARSLDWGKLQHEGNTIQPAAKGSADDYDFGAANPEPPASYVDTLLDLLVEEDCGSCEEDEDENDNTENYEEVENDYSDMGGDIGLPMADLSELTREERAFLQLRHIGLSSGAPKMGKVVSGKSTAPNNSHSNRQQHDRSSCSNNGDTDYVAGDGADEDVDDIDVMIQRMKTDLMETARLNHLRSTYLEAVVQATLETPLESRERKRVEGELFARHAALVKRNKEAKAKNGKNKFAKMDDLALPW